MKKNSFMSSFDLKAGRRRSALRMPGDDVVIQDETEDELVARFRPACAGVELVPWAAQNREQILTTLLKRGAILFRGFGPLSVDDFQSFIRAVSGEPLKYSERSSPRTTVSGHIYTSTDFPPHQTIFLHNENSYQSEWPLKLFFFSKIPATEGGETLLTNTRTLTTRVAPHVRQKFEALGILYVRNYTPGLGLTWQTAFQTDDKTVVEAYCQKAGIQYEWRGNDILRTSQYRAAIARHPSTGEEVWFNHATFFHVTTLEPGIRDALMSLGEENLPLNSYYGDGSPIEASTLDHLRKLYLGMASSVKWEQEDLLMLDNMVMAHGRATYKGTRKLLVGMSEPVLAGTAARSETNHA